MIKNILIPEQIGNYFIFSQPIIGIDIGKSHINATLVKASGTTTTIERCWQETIESSKLPHDERTVEALKNIMAKVKYSARIHTSIASSQVVFKTLKLPFISRHKINMVIRFEIEPLLPFSIQDAIVNFIITKQSLEEGSSEILVAAVQKKHIAHHLSLFESAGINPTLITVDMFALYGLYTQIPVYEKESGTTILIDLGIQSTRLAAIRSNQLYMVRSLAQGLSSIAKDISSAIDIPTQQALENIIRFGLAHSEPDFQQALKNSLSSFWNKIQFALNSLTNSNTAKANQLLLLGKGSEINGIIRMVTDQLALPCEQFDITKLQANPNYIVKGVQSIPNTHILSVAIALPTPITQDFNLRIQEFAPKEEGLLLKQLLMAVFLILFMGTALFTHLVSQKKALQNEIRLSENETIEMLKERFPSIPEDEDDLDLIKDSAESELKQEEEIWYAFTRQARASFLEYLLELTSHINKQELGFIIDRLTIVDGREGSITLQAHVRDFEALKKLEQALRESKLFNFVEGQTSPDFTMKILIGKREGS